MKDDSGRLALLWGPLLLVAVLVAVFRFAETGGGDPVSPASRSAAAGGVPAAHPPGAAATASEPVGPAGGVRGLDGAYGPFPAYPRAAYPPPYPAGPPGPPPWAWAPQPPWPGDHSGRYWGSGAAEWGPPIGEYGPDTQVDPYWWVAEEEAGGKTGR